MVQPTDKPAHLGRRFSILNEAQSDWSQMTRKFISRED
jgi:hypothetical protein